MPARTCPKCGNTLIKTNNYFCGYCGEILPQSLTLPPNIPGKHIAHLEVLNISDLISGFRGSFKSVGKVFPLKYLFILLGILSIFGGYTLYSNYSYLLFPNKIEEAEEVCSGDFLCGTFGVDNITSVVPLNVALYGEGFDFQKFSQFALDYDPSFSAVLDELRSLESQHFAVFVEYVDGVYYWTVVLVSSKEPSVNLVSMINNPQNLYIGRISSFYIVSSRNTILGDMQSAYNGIIKTITHNSSYSIAIGKHSQGELLLLSTDTEGDSVLNRAINSDKTPAYIKGILSQLRSKGGNYIVF